MTELDKKWLKPALIVFSNTEPTGTGTNWTLGSDYLYLTDDGRDSVQIEPRRIESRQQMINGRTRSYYVADKRIFSTSWSNIPSRSREGATGGDRKYISEYEKRAEGFSIKYGAGQDIKKWYDTYTGSFWMLLIYDGTFSSGVSASVEKYEVFFDSFNFDIVKRGQFNDLWNVSISLAEA